MSAVTEELTNIPVVTKVEVDFDAAGASNVTVTTDQPVTDESVSAALDAAGGYWLAAHVDEIGAASPVGAGSATGR